VFKGLKIEVSLRKHQHVACSSVFRRYSIPILQLIRLRVRSRAPRFRLDSLFLVVNRNVEFIPSCEFQKDENQDGEQQSKKKVGGLFQFGSEINAAW